MIPAIFVPTTIFHRKSCPLGETRNSVSLRTSPGLHDHECQHAVGVKAAAAATLPAPRFTSRPMGICMYANCLLLQDPFFVFCA